MFDLLDAKRIRRSDLNSPTSSRSSTPPSDIDLTVHTLASLNSTLGSLPAAAETPSCPVPQQQDEQPSHTFKLFAHAAPQAINLHPPISAPQPRPSSHYRRGPLTAEEHTRFTSVCISGQDVLRLARLPCPGSEYGWKVTHLALSSHTQDTLAGHTLVPTTAERDKRRLRKGKKARIRLRTRLRAEEAQRHARLEKSKLEEEQRVDKERYLREKKTATNRRKQLRKREKAREKKEVVGGEGGEEGEHEHRNM